MKKKIAEEDSFKKKFHFLYEQIDDTMEKHELKAYVRDDNYPRIKAMEESETITVEEVLSVGGYIVVAKLHEWLHEADRLSMDEKVNAMFEGKIPAREVIPEDLPEEIKDMLEGLVDTIRKAKKGKK